MRYAIRRATDGYYVSHFNYDTGELRWSPEVRDAVTWTYADVAEGNARCIGYVVTVGDPGNGDW